MLDFDCWDQEPFASPLASPGVPPCAGKPADEKRVAEQQREQLRQLMEALDIPVVDSLDSADVRDPNSKWRVDYDGILDAAQLQALDEAVQIGEATSVSWLLFHLNLN